VAGGFVPAVLRRPIHFGALLGLSTGLYATTLVGVAVLQQHADDDLAADRAPAVARAAELRAANDRLTAVIEGLGSREHEASTSYDAVRARVVDVEAELSALASTVGEVNGAAAALPQRISLPTVPSGGTTRVVSKSKAPPTHATTGASGGG
jgi:hypothetical protein